MDEGVRKNNDGYIIDLTKDETNDIINVIKPELYMSEFQDNVYYFGYKFNNNVGKKERSNFVNWLKSFTIDNVTPAVESFIFKPIKLLDKNVDIDNDISMIISPKSERSDLVRLIKRCISDYLPRYIDKKSYEIVKNLPNKIEFDWDDFNNDFVGDKHQYEQIIEAFDNIINGNILIIDDINTTGSTLTELIRIIKSFNKDCKIYIFTLIGR